MFTVQWYLYDPIQMFIMERIIKCVLCKLACPIGYIPTHKQRNKTMNIKLDYPHKTRSDYLETLVKALVRRRLELNITQEELNHKLGVADRLVSKWECGTRTPLTFHLYCWADALQSRLVIIPNRIESKAIISDLKQKAANDNFTKRREVANDNVPEVIENILKISEGVG